MPRRASAATLALIVAATVVAMSGCGDDRRVVAVTREAADRQAAQNVELARVARAAASGANDLVAADAASRRDAVTLQTLIQAERAELNAARDDLDQERQRVAADRTSAASRTHVVQGLGVLFVAVLALALAWLVLARGVQGDDLAWDVVIDHLVANQADVPRLETAPRRPTPDPQSLSPTEPPA